MIVEDQPDCGAGRIGGIEQLEEFDEFAAAMAVLDQGMDLAGDEVDPGQQADRAVPLICSRAKEDRPLCSFTSSWFRILHTVPCARLARHACPSAGPCSRAWRARSRVVHSSWG